MISSHKIMLAKFTRDQEFWVAIQHNLLARVPKNGGIAITDDYRILVADSGNHRVQVLTMEGS